MKCDKKSLFATVHTSKKLNLMTVGSHQTKNGLSSSLVDDPLFRNTLVTTDRMGQSVVFIDKGTALGNRDTTFPHRHTFSRKIIPVTDKRLDEDGMSRLKSRMKKVGGTRMSDG
jgi:hypothetical protein